MEIKSIMTIYREDKKSFWMKLAIMFTVALLAAFALGVYFALLEVRVAASELFHVNWLNLIRIKEWLLVFCLVLAILFAALFYRRETCYYLFKYRFLVAGIVFVTCVALEINGSSFNIWKTMIDGETNAPLIGLNRVIRSDEWMVFTPMAVSQYVNPMGSFAYFNPLLRATPTDYFIVYGQAVKDIAMIFRPFQIGYLFLSEGQGMAFFWCGRLIALFLVSFEFGRLLTKDRRVLSVVYAALLTFSPVVQWWFSVNGLVEMLVAGQLMIVLTDLYIDDHEAIWKKAVYSLTFFICAGIYAFTLYPAWEIPLAYVFFAIFFWLVITKRKSIKISFVDGLFLGFGALLLVGVSVHILMQSWGTIQTVLHTAYPGDRMENGGDGFLSLFNYPLSVFFPIKASELIPNECEAALFYDFFPLGLMVTGYMFIKEKKKDGFSIILLVLFVIFASRLIVPWPGWLSKITLLSKVTNNRLVMVVSWINLLILIRTIALIDFELGDQMRSWIYALAIVAFSVVIIVGAKFVQPNYAHKTILFISFVLLTLGVLGFVFYRRSYGKGILLTIVLIICFFSGMMVNPVNRGMDTVKSQSLYQDIKQINQKDDVWIVSNASLWLNNYPMMAGAATINTTNTYPNMDRWRQLYSDSSYDDIFNRYAHIVIKINSNVEFEVALPQADSIEIEMNPSYLKKLKVTKILSGQDLTPMATDEVSFKKIAEDSADYYVFEVQYAR